MHTTLTLPSTTSELPALLSGDLSITPSSGLGTNASRPEAERVIPRAVFFGGGVPDDEVQRVQRVITERLGGETEGKVAFLQVTREEVLALGASGPEPGVIAQVYRKKVAGL